MSWRSRRAADAAAAPAALARTSTVTLTSLMLATGRGHAGGAVTARSNAASAGGDEVRWFRTTTCSRPVEPHTASTAARARRTRRRGGPRSGQHRFAITKSSLHSKRFDVSSAVRDRPSGAPPPKRAEKLSARLTTWLTAYKTLHLGSRRRWESRLRGHPPQLLISRPSIWRSTF